MLSLNCSTTSYIIFQNKEDPLTDTRVSLTGITYIHNSELPVDSRLSYVIQKVLYHFTHLTTKQFSVSLHSLHHK